MLKDNNTEKAIVKDRLFLFQPGTYIPIFILGLLTLGFWVFDWDRIIQGMFYSRIHGWYLGEIGILRLVYHYGNYPALILAVLGLTGFILSYSKIRFLKWRKIGLYLTLVMAIGPGLITNTILKDQWGRPRPRSIIEYGGNEEYEYPLEIDLSSDGKSFPCGHATMGFYFYSLIFLVNRRQRYLRLCLATIATLYGSIIGLARITQGGHFLSDVVWAGFIIYMTCYWLYRILKMDRSIYVPIEHFKKYKLNRFTKMGLYLMIPLVITAVMLATPFSKTRKVLLDDQKYSHIQDVTLFLNEATMSVTGGEQNMLVSEVNGFGVPGSKVKYKVSIGDTAENVIIRQVSSGFFTELDIKAKLSLIGSKVQNLRLVLNKCNTIIEIGSIPTMLNMTIEQTAGELELIAPRDFGESIYVVSTGGKTLVKKGINTTDASSRYRVQNHGGEVIIR